MRVLGIDPGTATIGYGVVERAASLGAPARLLECGVLRTRPRDSLPARLATIHEGLRELLERHRPDVLAVEDIFYATNVRTTVVLGHARGVILLAGAQAGVAVAEYSPALVKKTVVGRGAALKPQVGYMVAKLLKLSAAPRPADAADAVAVALTHLLTGFRRGNGR
ncbi:MAG TPA: crossover junction endodeoxyribonuclease RuvC [Gemmatimonadales bacterium]|jgi:crossover junction endodeoxyribonuclease RuvC|nr:crossover junction endodeoxyribonuclease RuvC [Gemmatimonadales bacterium]